MADVFLSYANEDRTRVEKFVRALEQAGFSVFWDRSIPPGETWRDILDRELDAASCIVVVWSKNSVKSRWVLDEADAAKERLVPVRVDDVQPPKGFGQQQVGDLVGWSGEADSSFEAICQSIAARIGVPRTAPPQQQSRPARHLRLAALAVGLSGAVGAAWVWVARDYVATGQVATSTVPAKPAASDAKPAAAQSAAPGLPTAPPPEPRQRRVYFETFSDPKTVSPGLWALGAKDDWSGTVTRGEYKLCNAKKSSSSSYTSAFTYLDEKQNAVDQTDASVMLTVRLGAGLGDYSMAGVLFRASPSKDSYYALARSAGHSVTLLRKEGNSVKLLSTWGLPKVADEAPVTLRIEASRDACRLFVGDKLVDSVALPTIAGERHGVFAMGKGCFYFDDASLYLPAD